MFRGKPMAVSVFLAIFFILICSTFSGAEELNVQAMRISIGRMEDNLRTPFAKAGLEMTVWSFYRARVALSPNKYEANMDFQEGFKESFAIFQKRLRAGKFQEIQYKIEESNLRTLEKSYQRNKNKYLDFIRSTPITPYFPPNYPVGFITESQLYYSLLLFDVEKGLLAKAKRFTYIFPFCDD